MGILSIVIRDKEDRPEVDDPLISEANLGHTFRKVYNDAENNVSGMNATSTHLVITFRGSESARTIGLRLCGTRKRSPIKVLEERRLSRWRKEDLGLSCPKVPDESSVSSSGRLGDTKIRILRDPLWPPHGNATPEQPRPKPDRRAAPRRLLSGASLSSIFVPSTLLPPSPFSVSTSDNSQRAERCRSSMNTTLVAVGKRHSSHSSQRDRDLTSTFSPRCFLTSKFYLPFDYHHSVISLLSVIAGLTNLFTVSQEKNHQQGLMSGRFECLLVNNVPGVLGEIDVGGSADSTGVWIWTLLPRQKRPRERPRSAMGKRASLLALGKAFQNKEPRCWFNGGQYEPKYLPEATAGARFRTTLRTHLERSAKGSPVGTSPPLMEQLRNVKE
ncbi:Uncharacterized protein DBV15_07780 [Temnothorax longispinosus]|uniref:Uncharacterized protein n=1 Tax=Temnothorax longispinosus TaxID=300112 RepID=A0A4S2KNE8_9HYME|nr:Uncharacterized protein DBV15_07780 [Temnothorax longispinosus]